MRRQLLATVLISTVAICGCGSLSDGLSIHNPFEKKHLIADATNPAVEVACVWQPGEGRGLKGVPARGFEGQLFFFTSKDAEPALVNGTLRVYLFADRGTPEERGKPLQQYDYTPRELNAHAKMTSLGPGYALFVPYPDPEAYQVRCQLRVRFVPAEGPVIWSEALTMILEGPPRPGDEPNSWNTDEARELVGQGNHIEISRRSGTPSQLRKLADSEPPRKLRSDTFTMPQVQQVSHQVAESRFEQSRTDPPQASTPSLEESHEPDVPDHPLTARRITRRAKPHPLAATTTDVEPRGSQRHPPTRQNSATMENPPRFLLSHPLADPEVGDTAADAAASDGSQPTPSQLAVARTEAELQAQAVQRSALRDVVRPIPADATPVYRRWQTTGP